MKAATFDPARRLDLYFRCNRAGSKNFVFTYEDGTAYSFIYQEFALNIYRNEGEKKVLIILPLVYASNTLTASITKALSNINEGEYYYELYNVDTEETWLCGNALFHNGKFDGVSNDTEQVTISVTGEVINITLGITPDFQEALNAKQSIVNSAVALLDAPTIDLTAIKHTLSSYSSARTFTISYTGDDITLIVTLSATSATYTFPVTALCVSEGVASGNNTLSLSGVSGDKYTIGIKKLGSDYFVACKNFGQ